MMPKQSGAQVEIEAENPLQADYRVLAAFRYRLRGFQAWSERAAHAAGLEPQQHQMMLAIRGLPAGQVSTIGVLAERLQIRHHTAVELTDRLEANGLVARARTSPDHREVVISLTSEGERRLAPLLRQSLNTLAEVGPEMIEALRTVVAHASRG